MADQNIIPTQPPVVKKFCQADQKHHRNVQSNFHLRGGGELGRGRDLLHTDPACHPIRWVWPVAMSGGLVGQRNGRAIEGRRGKSEPAQ